METRIIVLILLILITIGSVFFIVELESTSWDQWRWFSLFMIGNIIMIGGPIIYYLYRDKYLGLIDNMSFKTIFTYIITAIPGVGIWYFYKFHGMDNADNEDHLLTRRKRCLLQKYILETSLLFNVTLDNKMENDYISPLMKFLNELELFNKNVNDLDEEQKKEGIQGLNNPNSEKNKEEHLKIIGPIFRMNSPEKWNMFSEQYFTNINIYYNYIKDEEGKDRAKSMKSKTILQNEIILKKENENFKNENEKLKRELDLLKNNSGKDTNE